MKQGFQSILLFLFLLGTVHSCTDKKKQEPEVMPVEADHGIGDGAPSLDSLLTQPKDTLQPD